MNIDRNKFLHYLLIALMVFAPVRSVLAMQQSSCDAGGGEMSAMDASVDHSSHDMSAMMLHDAGDQDSAMSNECCCCDNDCVSACDMNISTTLFLQTSAFDPVFKNSTEVSHFSTDTLVRALKPPARPPAPLYN